MMPARIKQSWRGRVWVMLPLLSDELLLEAYHQAVRLQLEREFVFMLRAEIKRRMLPVAVEELPI